MVVLRSRMLPSASSAAPLFPDYLAWSRRGNIFRHHLTPPSRRLPCGAERPPFLSDGPEGHPGPSMKALLSSPVSNFSRMTGSIKSALAGKRSSPVWCGRQVKRRRALRARNPPRDSLADGAPMASVLPGSQAEPGSLVGHRTPELCLPKRTGIRSLTSPAVIRQAAVLLLHRRELPPRLHPAMAPGGFFRC